MAEDKPSLLELAQIRMEPLGPKCGVRVALEQKPELADQIKELIERAGQPAVEGGVRYSLASSILREQGMEVKADTISRHRAGECSCRKVRDLQP